MAKAKRHHFLPQFYLKNFGDPLYSDNIQVYWFENGCWNPQPITPKGVGWLKHLYSTTDEEGAISDEYESKFFCELDNELADPMRKAATLKGCQALSRKEKLSLARFISYLFSRNPQTMDAIKNGFLNAPDDLRQFFSETDKIHAASLMANPRDPEARRHFNTIVLEGIQKRAEARAEQLLQMNWRFQTTGPERPLITSDLPIFADKKDGVELYTCPLSSTIAVIIASGGRFKQRRHSSATMSMSVYAKPDAKRMRTAAESAATALFNVTASTMGAQQEVVNGETVSVSNEPELACVDSDTCTSPSSNPRDGFHRKHPDLLDLHDFARLTSESAI